MAAASCCRMVRVCWTWTPDGPFNQKPGQRNRSEPGARSCRLQLTRILFESPRRPFRATGSSPMLAVRNFASEMMAATSSRPSFLIFQFLSSIFDTSSDVIFSLGKEAEKE